MLALPEDTGAKWKEISAANGQSGDNLSDTIQYHYIINKKNKKGIHHSIWIFATDLIN